MLERLRAFFDARDGWTKATDAGAETHPHGAAILALADSATGANPTRAFKDASAQLQAHRAFAITLLATALAHEGDGIEPDTGNRLRGLAWLTADAGGEEAAHVLARLAVFGWEKVRWHGPRSQKAANAAIRALATLPEGAPQLARLREQLKNPQALKAIDVAIGESAGRLGIPREEFEERVVSEPDLTPIEINGYRACVAPDGRLQFANANGRELKTTPAAVRGAPELATLRARAKDVAGIVAAQRSRLDLTTIDRRVFSEVMRDVDLFVAVTSIGNDPTWIDGGTDRAHAGYWRDYAFGELGAQAEVRRDLLEHLLPKLAIRDVATLDGCFLRVKGTLRSYKIHLGSANILMEPNDQHLCIVPGRGKDPSSTVFLPFEGDQGLALILSKAFLLSRDDKITDQTILTQIAR